MTSEATLAMRSNKQGLMHRETKKCFETISVLTSDICYLFHFKGNGSLLRNSKRDIYGQDKSGNLETAFRIQFPLLVSQNLLKSPQFLLPWLDLVIEFIYKAGRQDAAGGMWRCDERSDC